MRRAAIRHAVERKVDEKMQKAIDDAAEAQARSKVFDALYPVPKAAKPEDPKPVMASVVQPVAIGQRAGTVIISPSDPRITGL